MELTFNNIPSEIEIHILSLFSKHDLKVAGTISRDLQESQLSLTFKESNSKKELLTTYAAKHGHFELLEYLLGLKCKCDEETLSVPLLKGRSDIARRMLNNKGCIDLFSVVLRLNERRDLSEWLARTVISSELKDREEVVELVTSYLSQEIGEIEVYEYAIRNNITELADVIDNISCVEYSEEDIVGFLQCAFKEGNLSFIEYLRQRFWCLSDVNFRCFAEEFGLTHILDWMREQGCEIREH